MLPASAPAHERRFLPAVTSGFRLGERERLAEGLRRITVEGFDEAVGSLVDRTDVGKAVHEARKATKRLRSVLRLVRSELGNRTYRAENAVLRDSARLLAPVRDATARLLALDGLRDRFEAQLRSTALESLAEMLTERHRAVLVAAPTSEEWRRAVYALRSARARYAAWPVDEEIARALGTRVIPHAYSSVGPGLRSTYQRGRQEMADASHRPTAEHFHTWRKRVKYLRHQIEVIAPLWPDLLDGYAASLSRLGDFLGDEHDLVGLLRAVAASPGLCLDPVERSLLVALAQHRRAELQSAALALGARVYAESPGRFTERLEVYWEAWDRPVAVGFTV